MPSFDRELFGIERWQAITWTNDGQVYYACLNRLNPEYIPYKAIPCSAINMVIKKVQSNPVNVIMLVRTFLHGLSPFIGHIMEARDHLVCCTTLMALFIKSVGGLSKCFCQGLWLANLNAGVIRQSITRRGVP